ncbi:uncharacterized protein LTR77_002285 [Saxophila tyrrhenica]|uniref:KANL3/Tex30 alpha/beta hydrolase-like domain-containing protein n=1 Tax=Saxophila tyrrhenica TaxID=1690608 RepID=A0AAV9PJ26_9PEZI|nr:hypothetical protein LTR77_002285 [Saxophila tyrrhenica]
MPKRKRNEPPAEESTPSTSKDETTEASTTRVTRSRNKPPNAPSTTTTSPPPKAQKESPKPPIPTSSFASTEPTATNSPNEDAFHASTIPHPQKDKGPIQCQRHGPSSVPPSLVFTHGAGGDLANEGVQLFCEGFAATGRMVWAFEGSMNLKSRVSGFDAVLAHLSNAGAGGEGEGEGEDEGVVKANGGTIALGGTSMGARAAVVAATNANASQRSPAVEAVVLASYPLIGASKGDVRDQILYDLPADIDVLFICGTEDSMCPLPHLNSVRGRMEARSWLIRVQDAAHGLGLKGKGKGAKAGTEALRREVGVLASEWLTHRDGDGERGRVREVRWDAERGEVQTGEWCEEG